MEDLIKALLIFQKYIMPDYFSYKYPTICEHDTLYVKVDPNDVSEENKSTLAELGFYPSQEVEGCFVSYRFGS